MGELNSVEPRSTRRARHEPQPVSGCLVSVTAVGRDPQTRTAGDSSAPTAREQTRRLHTLLSAWCGHSAARVARWRFPKSSLPCPARLGTPSCWKYGRQAALLRREGHRSAVPGSTATAAGRTFPQDTAPLPHGRLRFARPPSVSFCPQHQKRRRRGEGIQEHRRRRSGSAARGSPCPGLGLPGAAALPPPRSALLRRHGGARPVPGPPPLPSRHLPGLTPALRRGRCRGPGGTHRRSWPGRSRGESGRAGA